MSCDKPTKLTTKQDHNRQIDNSSNVTFADTEDSLSQISPLEKPVKQLYPKDYGKYHNITVVRDIVFFPRLGSYEAHYDFDASDYSDSEDENQVSDDEDWMNMPMPNLTIRRQNA